MKADKKQIEAYRKATLQALQFIHQKQTAQRFVQMAKQNPAAAISFTTAIAINAVMQAAQIGGVVLGMGYVKPIANQVSKYLGKMLVVAGVLKKEQLQQIMRQAGQMYEQSVNQAMSQGAQAPQGAPA